MADAKNEADNKVFQLEKLLKESGDKINEADKAPIHAGIENVKKLKEGNDLAALKAAIASLDQAATAMAQHIYAKPGATAGETPPTPSSTEKKPGDDVMDAEYEVKK